MTQAPHPGKPSPAERLRTLRERYAEEPTSSEGLLAELRSLAAELQQGPADDALRVELARFAGILALEQRDPKCVEALIARALQVAALPEDLAAELNCFMARADIQQQRYEPARQRLADAQRCEAPLARALCLATGAQLAHREGEMARADALAAEALQRFATLDWPGPWVQSFATRTIALRQLGRPEARAAVLAEGLEHCVAQRRWSEAANLASGLFDLAIDRQDLDGARRVVAQMELLARHERSGEQGVGKAMLRFSRARLLAAEGCYAEACVDMAELLAQQRHRLVAYDYALRLNQLADWQLRCGQAQLALQTATEAQQIEREQLQLARQRNLLQLREALAVEQAERERAASQAHAQRMEAQQAELASTLAQRRALHEELVEARKLAGLGQLLVGLSQSLDTPLRDALAAVAQAHESMSAVRDGVASGAALSRRALLDAAQTAGERCQQAQALLEQSIVEIDAYRELRHET